MKYIGADEFLSLSQEVQNIFIEWWRNNLEDFDLWFEDFGNSNNSYLNGIWRGCLEISLEQKQITKQKSCRRKPLLTEGQLREFIQDKTGNSIDIKNGFINKDICCDIELKFLNSNKFEYEIFKPNTSKDLLQVYWEIAVKIARAEVIVNKRLSTK